MYIGEIISLTVAISWTATAMFAEVASKRMGSLPLNVLRMILSLLFLGILLWCFTGSPLPLYADSKTWIWLSLSGFVGYVLGDFCLFNSYILIGSRFGQLLMTLSAPTAAIFGWILLGEQMSWLAILGMVVTMTGISMSILNRSGDDGHHHVHLQLPAKGLFFGCCAGIGQGAGLVLSTQGLMCYKDSLAANGITEGTILFLIPFTATAIRAITGLVGFSVWTVLKGQTRQLAHAVTDKKGMLFTLLATLTGPFIGVSLSLMATLYTATGIAQTIMATTPVLILLPSYLFFHQRITLKEIIGAVVAVIGVTLFFI